MNRPRAARAVRASEAAIGRDALPRLPKGNGNSAKPEAPPTRRGKAPWRTARCACRPSFPKISRRCDFREPYFTACGVSADADHLHGRLFCRWRCSTDLNRRANGPQPSGHIRPFEADTVKEIKNYRHLSRKIVFSVDKPIRYHV